MAFPEILRVRIEPEPSAGPIPENLYIGIDFRKNGFRQPVEFNPRGGVIRGARIRDEWIVYGFTFGPTDVNGIIEITCEEVQTELDESRNIFIMDYKTPLSEITSLAINFLSGEKINDMIRWQHEQKSNPAVSVYFESKRRIALRGLAHSLNSLFYPTTQDVFLDSDIHNIEIVLNVKRK